MDSKEVCDAICTLSDLDNVVNAWQYDNETRTCTCAWLTSLICDWNSITLHHHDSGLSTEDSIVVAYIQSLKTLPCGMLYSFSMHQFIELKLFIGCQRMNSKIGIEESDLTVRDTVEAISTWHCQKVCQADQQCTAYEWQSSSRRN